jgi:cytochrome P450
MFRNDFPCTNFERVREHFNISSSWSAGRISNEVVRIRGIQLARQILRSDGHRQAGFMAEIANRFTRRSHAPVLFQEGEAHRKQRSATARFFAPKVVATRYRQLMLEQSKRLMKDLRSTGRA